MLGCGEIDSGVEHLSNAVAVCGQPQQLLQVLQQTLPPQIFSLLLERLPSVGQVLPRIKIILNNFVFDLINLLYHII